MGHGEAIGKAARACFEEYQRIDREHIGMLVWEDLDSVSKANWAHIARVAVTTYNEWK